MLFITASSRDRRKIFTKLSISIRAIKTFQVLCIWDKPFYSNHAPRTTVVFIPKETTNVDWVFSLRQQNVAFNFALNLNSSPLTFYFSTFHRPLVSGVKKWNENIQARCFFITILFLLQSHASSTVNFSAGEKIHKLRLIINLNAYRKLNQKSDFAGIYKIQSIRKWFKSCSFLT